MGRALSIIVALAGCDRVLGVDHFDHPPIDAAIDAPIIAVAGQLDEIDVTNSSMAIPVLRSRFPAEGAALLSVTLDDGSTPAVAYDAMTGAFSFERAADQRYRLAVGSGIEYQLAAPSPRVRITHLGRADRVPVTQPTGLQFNYTVGANAFPLLVSTGVFTFTNPQIAGSGTFGFNWQNAGSFDGPPALLDATKFDRLYYLNMVNVSGTVSVGGVSVSNITMQDGVAQLVTTPLAAVSPNSCAHVIAFRAEAVQREVAAVPGPYSGGVRDAWSIYNVPSQSLANNGNTVIVFAPDGTTPTDVDVGQPFFRPLPGDLLASIEVNAAFTLQLPGTSTPAQVANGLNTLVPVSVANGNCLVNLATLASTVGIPKTISIAGTALASDNLAVPLPASDLTVTWTSSTGPVDFGELFLYELVNQSSATVLVQRGASIVVAPTGAAILRHDLLESGHTYALVAQNRIGNDVGVGDYATIHYPFETASTCSHSFVVR